MTEKEKQLLLKDLCSRLPYGVKIHINSCIEEQNQMRLFDVNLEGKTIGVGNEKWAFRAIPIVDREDNTKIVKPYLRSMSSMTKEERLIYEQRLHDVGRSIDVIDADDVVPHIDWLLSRHLDFRGLIPMGLALEAKEGMYKTE